MAKFYFTYGTEGHPFFGGWTEVDAPDRDAAETVFRAFHPDKHGQLLNCCSVYDEEQFKRTAMYGPAGNFGYRCHETITLRRELTSEGGLHWMIGLVVTTDNEMSKVNYDAPHYDVIQKAVGGWYGHVHPVGLQRPYCMMVNEEGLLIGLPMNQLGSELYGTPRHGQPIVGNVIFLKDGYHGGEPDVVGMTEDEAQALGDRFAKMTGGIVHWAKN